MYKPELRKDLQIAIQSLKKEMAESDAEKIQVAQEIYQELLEEFYKEYEDMMAIDQRSAARNDPDYFLVLIKLAYFDQEFETVDSQLEQLISYPNWKLFTRI